MTGGINIISRIARFLESILNDLNYKVSCDYLVKYPVDPMFYPTVPSTAPIGVTGNAAADTWSNEVIVLPAATIDAEGGTHFSVLSMSVEGPADRKIFFELLYNSDIVAKGYAYTSGSGVNLRRAGNSFFEIISKATGENLTVRVMASVGSTDVDVRQIVWCNSAPPPAEKV